MVVAVRSVFQRFFLTQFQLRRFCSDMSAALQCGIHEAFPGAHLSSDYQHVANGPKKKWRKFITHKNSIPLITYELYLVSLMRCDIAAENVLAFAIMRWCARGEHNFANHIQNNHGRGAARHGPYHWYFAAVQAFGFICTTNPMERYWLSLLGNPMLEMASVLPVNKGFSHMLTVGLKQVCDSNDNIAQQGYENSTTYHMLFLFFLKTGYGTQYQVDSVHSIRHVSHWQSPT
jgi:hypothetical protein